MNADGEFRLNKLDLIVNKINQELLSIKSSKQKHHTLFFLSETMVYGNHHDITPLLEKINKYKKMRKATSEMHNNELMIVYLMDIFSDTQNIIKNLSNEENIFEYVDVGFFKRFSEISRQVKRLLV